MMSLSISAYESERELEKESIMRLGERVNEEGRKKNERKRNRRTQYNR